MSLSKWIGQAKDLSFSALSMASDAVGAGAGYVQETIGAAWIFGSTETSEAYEGEQLVDEKHYFLMPDRRSEAQYSLYVMRCLPEGVPPINDLPKKRMIHLPSEHALPTLEHLLVHEARESAVDDGTDSGSIGARLSDIADQIDRLDGKVFNGVLLIGGLVALVNPAAGVAVAAKALLPSIGLLLSKYGLQYAGDAANASELTKKVRSAEKQVMHQFRNAGADSLVNPLLAQLDRGLETNESEYEPMLHFDSEEIQFSEEDGKRLLKLTCQAITNAYRATVADPSQYAAASLGPEDIRFLKILGALANEAKHD